MLKLLKVEKERNEKWRNLTTLRYTMLLLSQYQNLFKCATGIVVIYFKINI